MCVCVCVCVYTHTHIHTHAYNTKCHIFKVSKPMGYKNNTLFPLLQATENTSV